MPFRCTFSLQVHHPWRRLVYKLTKYCITCKNLRFSRLIYLRREAKASASLGCRYCILILNALEHFCPNSANDDLKLIDFFREGGRYSLRVDGDVLDVRLELELYTPAGKYKSCLM